MERRSCSTKLREASELIDRLFVCSAKVAPLALSAVQPQQQSPTAKKKLAYMDQINSILAAKSSEDGVDYLKTTVVDLLHEVEVLKLKLEESRQENSALKQEMTTTKQEDRDRIDALVSTLQKATNSEECTLSQEKAETLNGEEASLMTITALTRKIEELNVKNSQLVLEKQQMEESMEDLHCEAEVKQVKIKALEAQFKSINRTRQKVVHRLGVNGNYGPGSSPLSSNGSDKENNFPSRPSPVSDRPIYQRMDSSPFPSP